MSALIRWLPLALPLLMGCQSAQRATDSAPRSIRSNCYSLLHQLLDEEKDVSKLHFLKHEEPDVKTLLDNIAKVSAAGAKELEEFARQDAAITLEDFRLPGGETRTRDAIASTKTWELLSESGDEFELALLLSQAEALTYGWHLAKVAANHESNPAQARRLEAIQEQLQAQYRQLVTILLARMKATSEAGKQTRGGQN